MLDRSHTRKGLTGRAAAIGLLFSLAFIIAPEASAFDGPQVRPSAGAEERLIAVDIVVGEVWHRFSSPQAVTAEILKRLAGILQGTGFRIVRRETLPAGAKPWGALNVEYSETRGAGYMGSAAVSTEAMLKLRLTPPPGWTTTWENVSAGSMTPTMISTGESAESLRKTAFDQVWSGLPALHATRAGSPAFNGGSGVAPHQVRARFHRSGPVPEGRIVWAYESPSGLWSGPAPSGGRLIVADNDGKIIALDAASGKVAWTAGCPKGERISSAPEPGEDVILVGTCPDVGSGSDRKTSGVIALNASDGRTLWRHECGSFGVGALGLSGSLAIAASYDFGEGRIWGLEASTGRAKWSLTVPARVLAPPMIDGGIAYFLSTREFIGVALDSGRIAWRLPPGVWARDGFSDPQNTPLIANGRIFASDDRSLAAVDLSAAKTAWTFTAGQSIDSSPLESGGTLFIRAKDGFLYALRADTGKLLWKTKLKEPFHSGAVMCAPLALVDGVIYAGTDNGQLFAIDPKSGSPLWIKDSGGTNGGPIVREGRIFIAHGASVLCLR